MNRGCLWYYAQIMYWHFKNASSEVCILSHKSCINLITKAVKTSLFPRKTINLLHLTNGFFLGEL